MRVDIERAKAIQKERMEINSVELEELEIYKNGKRVSIDDGVIEEFKFTGLNNMDFILGLINS